MNIIEQYALAEQVKFWTNTITLGLMRAAVVAVLVPILAVLLPLAVVFWAFGGFR